MKANFTMPKFAEHPRGRLTGLLDARVSVSETARQLGVTSKAVRKWREKFKQTGNVKDLPRSRKLCITSAFQRFVHYQQSDRSYIANREVGLTKSSQLQSSKVLNNV